MKKWYLLMLLVLMALLVGCNSKNENPDSQSMTGYVMDKEGERILIVDDDTQDFSSIGGVKEFYNAIWFSEAPSEIREGDFVEVWFDMVAESFPGQSAIKIEVVKQEKPKGADLTKSEALHKLLTSDEIKKDLYGVSSIKYNEKEDTWNIALKNLLDDTSKPVSFTVVDN